MRVVTNDVEYLHQEVRKTISELEKLRRAFDLFESAEKTEAIFNLPSLKGVITEHKKRAISYLKEASKRLEESLL